MIRVAAVLVFLSISIKSVSQAVLDVAYLRCTYTYCYLTDTNSRKEGEKDLLILQIGKNISKCYSYYSYQVDSLCQTPNYQRAFWDKFNKSMEAEGVHSSSYYHKRLKTYVYKGYPEGKMTVTDGISTEAFVYEDKLSAFSWSMSDSVKSILGYSCQKAVCRYRGRSYEAWFAADIPVNDGPWKFAGLPGLIMEVYDVGRHYSFTIKGVEKVDNEPIIFSKPTTEGGKYVATFRSEFLRGLKSYLLDKAGYIEAETGISLSGSSNTKALSYDLIERDYAL